MKSARDEVRGSGRTRARRLPAISVAILLAIGCGGTSERGGVTDGAPGADGSLPDSPGGQDGRESAPDSLDGSYDGRGTDAPDDSTSDGGHDVAILLGGMDAGQSDAGDASQNDTADVAPLPVCQYGTRRACYTGPQGTAGVGACKTGEQECLPDGSGWTTCLGQVLPIGETCATAADDDCDGRTNEEGPGCTCVPDSRMPCYTGPPGSKDVGICKGGTMACNSLGTGFGLCLDEVVPKEERCDTPVDDDCNGHTNEGGPGCLCTPDSKSFCYSGPSGTDGVGPCRSGTKTCNGAGTAYGPCAGEIVPRTEDCATPVDEDCDGATPPCAPIVDLRADVNRNGTVDLADPTEDADEETWTDSHGAIFLPNVDDDRDTCLEDGLSDDALAACHDAADEIVNGPDDLLDLARLRTVPWPAAPDGWQGRIGISRPGAAFVRLFVRRGSEFERFDPGVSLLSAAELRAGVELAIEGKDIVRNHDVWDGYVKVTLAVGTAVPGNGPEVTDSVTLRLAPVIFHHHLARAEEVFFTANGTPGALAFRGDLLAAMVSASVENYGELTIVLQGNRTDQWAQDFFETGYVSMPGPGGAQKVIRLFFRSANRTDTDGLRPAGAIVYRIRGKDRAALVQYDVAHPDHMDTLNSFGNLETIPPHTNGVRAWPLGRVIRGSTPQYYPDRSFDRLVVGQGVQTPMVTIDTEWLFVGHLDETISFVRASSARGWALLANDPAMARRMLMMQQAAGHGSTQMFEGKSWIDDNRMEFPAQVSIDNILADVDVMAASNRASAMIAEQIDVLKAETGLTDAEIVSVPFLHHSIMGANTAYQPGTVNGLALTPADFAAPDPHGPVIDGSDIFKVQLANVLQPLGVKVHWVEDWDSYHRFDGEVHCGTNATREVGKTPWWTEKL